MTDLMKGKVAAITGAASGIGLECARTLHRGRREGRAGRSREGQARTALRGTRAERAAAGRGSAAAVARSPRMLPKILDSPAASTSSMPTPAPISAARSRTAIRTNGIAC